MAEPHISQDAQLLREALARLFRRLRAEGPSTGLGISTLSILGRLHRAGPLSASELAVCEQLKPQSLTRILSRLEHEGYIRRSIDLSDRRRSQLEVTSAGKLLLRAEVAAREAWLASAMAAELSPAELAVLRLATELMNRLAASEQSRPETSA
jgi:DNA-binding MarR family transcriptional regulator